MRMLPHHPLPLATTSPFTPGGRPVREDPQAWSRALAEAVQCSPSGAGPRAGAAAAPSLQLMPSPPGTSSMQGPEPHAASPIRGWGSGFLAGATVMRSAGLPQQGQESWPAYPGLPPLQAVGTRSCERVPHEETTPASSPAFQRQQRPPSPAAGVHVHVEHRPDGVAVWLGVDRRVRPESLQALFTTLRAPARQGPSVVSITCNGVAVFTRSPVHKETP